LKKREKQLYRKPNILLIWTFSVGKVAEPESALRDFGSSCIGNRPIPARSPPQNRIAVTLMILALGQPEVRSLFRVNVSSGSCFFLRPRTKGFSSRGFSGLTGFYSKNPSRPTQNSATVEEILSVRFWAFHAKAHTFENWMGSAVVSDKRGKFIIGPLFQSGAPFWGLPVAQRLPV